MALAMAAGCSSSNVPASAPGPAAPVPIEAGGLGGRIEVQRLADRPRLMLVTRDGDPAPAMAVAVASDAGPALTAALSAIVEARLEAAGFDVDAEVDRSGFRVRWLVDGSTAQASLQRFVAALASAMQTPVSPGPDTAAAAKRLGSLRHVRLDAPELAAVAACTGELGLAGRDPLADATSAPSAQDLEAARKSTLHAGRASLAAVGPAAFCTAATAALGAAGPWAAGTAPTDPVPPEDVVTAYASPSVDRSGMVLSIAARFPDPRTAVAAADRLAAPGSPLLARLSALPAPWRVTEVSGTARPRGGCVAVELAIDQLPAAPETVAAHAAAVVQKEIRAEVSAAADPLVAARRILSAAAGDAASRAAWWALSGSVEGGGERWAIALGLPPPGQPRAGDVDAARKRFASDLAAVGGGEQAPERRLAVEQGQGELWILAASPCGVADEGAEDAGTTALAALAAVAAKGIDRGDVRVEPWLTQDGVGILAHAAPRDATETPAALARRVAGAVGRILVGTSPSQESLGAARALALGHLERTGGRQAVALDALATALSPERPSWIEPLGTWDHVAGGGLEQIRLRWQALASGQLRVAVIANGGADQARVAADAVDRWLLPRASAPRACREPAPPAPRAGRFEVRLPAGSAPAQALVASPLPAAETELAAVTAAALGGDGGLLAATNGGPKPVVTLRGGARSLALVIDVRAPRESLPAALASVKAALAKLATSGPSEEELRAAMRESVRRRTERLGDPRQRLVELWRGPGAARPQVDLASWRTYLAKHFAEDRLVIVEALPEH